jgi:PAS domain S-box-containing protein
MNFGKISRRAWRQYAAAVLFVAAAAGLRAGLLGALGGRVIYVTFYPAVMLAALYGGRPAGLMATALSAVAASWWMQSSGALFSRDPADWLGLVVFLVSCTMITIVCEAMHRAQAQAPKVMAIARIADERRRVEEALRQSELKYRFISENTGDVIWLFDWEMKRFTYVNPSVERLRGFSPEEAVGQTMEEALTPESLKVMSERLAARIAALEAGDESARVSTNEVDQLCRDGSVVPTEVVSTLLQDEAGRVMGIVGVARDITERNAVEAAVRESEAAA